MHEIGIENFPKRAAVRVSQEFLALLKTQARKQFGSLAKLSHKMASPDLAGATIYSELKNTRQKQLFPLPVLLRCCKACNTPLNILQQNIAEYGLRRSNLLVTKPTIPIRTTPIFDMLYAHHIADGFVVDPKHNRMPYFGYCQFDTFYRLLYFEKIQAVFGQINFDYYNALATTKIYCPPSVSQFFFKAYDAGPRDFLSETALLPQEILKKPKEHLLAVLIAFLIDEGHVDGSCLVIRLKNRLLVQQLHEICKRLKYDSKISAEPNDYAVLYVLSKGIPPLWQDYIELSERYPVIDLGWKGERIRNYLECKNRTIRNTPGNKARILMLLKERPLTINDVAEKIKMTRQGARYILLQLVNEQKIQPIGISKFGAVRYATIA
jgi:hypothetical protein